ncbi:MAG: hypothetical protein OXG52_13060 [bacterium]|nr:hypothetical protein [bacterium]
MRPLPPAPRPSPRPRRAARLAAAVRLLTLLGLLASSLAPAVLAPSAAAARRVSNATTVEANVSVEAHPDYVRVGWKDDDGDGTSDADPTPLSVRHNDEVVFERCAAHRGDEGCVELTATCGATFEDMEELHSLLDGLSHRIQQSWDAQQVATGETPGVEEDGFKLPEYGQTSQIGLDELLQAAWPLLPMRWMFLDWDMAFKPGDSTMAAVPRFAVLLRREAGADFGPIRRDHATEGWGVRNKNRARAQIDISDPEVNPGANVAAWVANRDSGVTPRFPTFTLGALLDPATLARQVDVDAAPDTSTAFGTLLSLVTGGSSFNDWADDVQAMSGPDAAAALDPWLSPQQRAELASTDPADVAAALRELRAELDAAAALHAELNASPQSLKSDLVPYTVRSVLAYLKIIAEDPDNTALGGFGRPGARSYHPYWFPFHVLFEAPDLVVGLLELFGLERPAYRSVRDIRIYDKPEDEPLRKVIHEERAESLLIEMFDFCANDLLVPETRFLRWEDPFAGGASGAGSNARAGVAAEPGITGASGFHLASLQGSRLSLTGTQMGETTLWYCYSFGLSGCAEPWTPVTVLVEPAGWDDARVVIQRDHFHVVVDWKSGRIMVLRPSASPAAPYTLSTAGWPAGFDREARGISDEGTWRHDEHVRDYMPPTGAEGWKYEIVSQYCCFTDPAADWSFEVDLPVMDNDEVHFYDKPRPAEPAGTANELKLLEGVSTCDTSRYCEHLRIHELAGRRKLPYGGDLTIDVGADPSALTARISPRQTARGATAELFEGGKKRAFDWFSLSYCVSALNVGCENWTDRRSFFGGGDRDLTELKQGHCVMATSLEEPVAPNAPPLLTVREWARRTGRPQGEFYFARNMVATGLAGNVDELGWDSHPVMTNDRGSLRNFDCPALDPQNPALVRDWGRPDNPPDNNCRGTESDGLRRDDRGRVIHETTSYADAMTNEYRAYRQFWMCPVGRAPIVAKYDHGQNRAGHPTRFNALVTLEFINPGTSIGESQYPAQDDSDDGSGALDAKCLTDFPLREQADWDESASWDPAGAWDPAGDRTVPGHWCYPLVPCWDDEGVPLWQRTAASPVDSPELAAFASCPHHGTGGESSLEHCMSFHQVIVPHSSETRCDFAAAANFALTEGCISPKSTVLRLPLPAEAPNASFVGSGWGVLIPGHDRRLSLDYGGAFRDGSDGDDAGLDSEIGREAHDPGLPLFSVSATLNIDDDWEFCYRANMSVVGVWPTFPPPTVGPDTQLGDLSSQGWPYGACDNAPDASKLLRFEINKVCEHSYPRLYDSDSDPDNGIQLDAAWRECLNAAPGTRAQGPRCGGEPVPGCVGLVDCEGWVIPQPGFYRVRILVEVLPVLKTGQAAQVATQAESASFTADSLLPTRQSFEDPDAERALLAQPAWREPDDPLHFVFDKIIWAQSLYTGSS